MSFRRLGLSVITFSVFFLSWGEPDARANMSVGETVVVEDISFRLESFELCDQTQRLSARRLQCRERDQISLGLKALTVTAGATTAICGIAGGPVTVGLGIFTAVSALAEFTVSSLPCDDPQEEELFNWRVCEVLLAQGIECDPSQVEFNRE